ncbi:MAG: sigma-70 family RNA polymerase sigma factor [Wenzhouxiangellaceae bacterium]|nr:sigma-70 family RNA polymerase sigma factor [Wenzhouxiangellaceae bacterium]MBS3746631.1 sigma-70 family RNA polymerase sigma factor [Wenzhouxiangellaceae bacterium]MBS3823445.1 sigma-70 family RNA polymerase sigma factor [Wenzhouxiangellaceae bacterium]
MKRRFEQLVDQHGGRLFQLARLMLGRDDEAEDVAQETLVKLWKNVDKLREGEELPWLMTCTRNACLDVLRGRTRTRSLLQLVASQKRALGEADHAGPAEEIHSNERVRALRSAIQEMPEPGRSLLILRDIQELDVATVARALGLSANQVKVYTFRARRQLRFRLEEESNAQVA